MTTADFYKLMSDSSPLYRTMTLTLIDARWHACLTQRCSDADCGTCSCAEYTIAEASGTFEEVMEVMAALAAKET
ncbi:MAG: hypothetical protein INH34_18090 [Phycisphaerales bacterium]|nr:hypothetical protein [Phycisphaerales bacterium]